MNNLWRKSFMAGVLLVSLTAGAVTPAFASAAPDGKTDDAGIRCRDARRQPSGGQQMGERHVRPQHVESLRAREALRHTGRRTAA